MDALEITVQSLGERVGMLENKEKEDGGQEKITKYLEDMQRQNHHFYSTLTDKLHNIVASPRNGAVENANTKKKARKAPSIRPKKATLSRRSSYKFTEE